MEETKKIDWKPEDNNYLNKVLDTINLVLAFAIIFVSVWLTYIIPPANAQILVSLLHLKVIVSIFNGVTKGIWLGKIVK